MTDHDPAALSERIRRAADQGRISAADRDIRLRNVASARSDVELDLIARDLDVLEAAISPGSASSAPAPAPAVVPRAPRSRRGLVVAAAVAALAIVTAGVVGLFATGGGDAAGPELFSPQPIESASPAPTEQVDETDPPASYALTAPGLRAFLADYQRTFDTPLAVSLVLYDDYAIVQVPQTGTTRHAQALFRKGEGWQQLGDVSANFPGSRAVDLRRLDVDALVRNLARARRTLRVAEPTQTYVVVQQIRSAEPAVNVYVANDAHESGYLATRLDGRVERAYPYQAQ